MDSIDLFAQPDDEAPPPSRPRRTKNSPLVLYYLQCQFCSVHTEWESDIQSWTAGVMEARAQGWRRRNKEWVCPECTFFHCRGMDKVPWRCGVCGRVKDGNWDHLLPIYGPDGWRYIACAACRKEHPNLVIARDLEMWADYPAVDEGDLPFHLDEYAHSKG